jgi:hypothetical protein
MQFLYHMRPKEMRGDTLYPLNQLHSIHPDLFSLEESKYEGREELMKEKIPTLECLWNDALHFTAVHPSTVIRALRAAGLDTSELERSQWFKIPLAALDQSKATIYHDAVLGDGQYETLSESNVSQITDISNETKQYYANTIAAGERPFLFHGVPHVLYKDALDTRGFEIVTPLEPMEKMSFI